MPENLTDSTGVPVAVERDLDHSAFRVVLADDGRVAGRAFFFDRADATPAERVFFHTEVDDDLSGRGLATVLVRESLAATKSEGLLVVPVCPLVNAYLRKHAAEHEGDFRAVRPADIDEVKARVGGGA